MSQIHAISPSAARLLPLEHNEGRELNNGLTQAYEMLDQLLAHSLRLSASFVETGQTMGLDPKSAQKLFSELQAHTGTMIQSRERLMVAHQQAHRIRLRSTMKDAQMFGCPRIGGEPGSEAPIHKQAQAA